MPVQSPTVLVVDDDPVVVSLLRVNFEMGGFRVLTASDGPSALALARDARPDVVILDVMMPKMSGADVARELRASESTAGVPLLLLSAKAQAADIDDGLSVADDYVTKPFDPLELLERVEALLARGSQAT